MSPISNKTTETIVREIVGQGDGKDSALQECDRSRKFFAERSLRYLRGTTNGER